MVRAERTSSRVFLTLLTMLTCVVPALADEIVVRGDRLRGTVVTVTQEKVIFETAYGEGNIEIPVEDVESLVTEKEYVIAHGDEATARGRIVGIEQGVLLVGPDRDEAERVEVAEITLVQSQEAIEESPFEWAKSRLRYWSGNLDLGLSLTQGTVDTTQFSLGLGGKRVKDPTRFSFDLGFLYGIQKERDETQSKLADQLFGRLREEYDFTERFYGYGNGYVEYNAIQRLSIRGIPEAGVGYKFWKSEEKDSEDFVAGTVGPSWVYEKFFGGRDQNYVAIAFGGEAHLTLPYDAELTATVTYLPSVSDFANDYLIRSQAALTLPLYEQLSFKLSVADDYDNTPAPNTSFNYLTTIVGLSAEL